MGNRQPTWEKEFWHYVSTGDGVGCPVYQNCSLRLKGAACSCPMYSALRGGQSDETFCQCANTQASFCFGNSEDKRQCASTNFGFMEKLRPGRIFELLRLLSESWLKIGGIKGPPVPLDLINVMDTSRDIEVRTVPMKAYSGAIWKTNDGWVVYLNSNECVARQRITLFHEAFHILAHCKATPVFKKRGSDKGAFNELLADNFALHILMPGKWMEERWAMYHDPAVLAEQFQVPEQAVIDRLGSLNLL